MIAAATTPIPRTAEQLLDEAWRRGTVEELEVHDRWILARVTLDGQVTNVRIPREHEPTNG